MLTLSNSGNYRTLYQLSNEVRMAAQPMMRFGQFSRIEEGFTSHMGTTYRFLKVSNLDKRGRRIGELEDVPEATSSSTYGECTVAEYGLQIKWSWMSSLVNQFSLEDMHIIQLRDDAAVVIDQICAAPYMICPVVYTPTGPFAARTAVLTTTGNVTTTAQRPADTWDLINIVDWMRQIGRVPGWGGGKEYVFLTNAFGTRGIKQSKEWIMASLYAQPEKLLTGEVGMYYNLRIVEESNILRAMPGGGGEGVIFGDDPNVMIEIYPLEIQAGFGGGFQYGRVKGVRWVWVGGTTIVYNFLADSRTTIVRISSAGLPTYVQP